MLECDTEIGPSVFMNLSERNQWGKRYIKDEAEFDLCTEGEGKCSAEPGPEEMAILDSVRASFEVLADQDGQWISLWPCCINPPSPSYACTQSAAAPAGCLPGQHRA